MPSEFSRSIAARLARIKPHQHVRRVTPFLEELCAALDGITADLNGELERRGVTGSASVECDDESHDLRVHLSVLDRIAFVDVCSQAEGRLFKVTGALSADMRVPAEGFCQVVVRSGTGSTLFTAPEFAQAIVRALSVKCITGY